MDVEGLVKEKSRLQEKNKELKKRIEYLEVENKWKKGEVEKLKDKLKEISLISGGIKITIIKRMKRWLK
ncbi:hypothetical protein GOV13_02665 [Candidatus Pacearchaeota archaeon]|nr:hypothetical protein [Candidatus Pacearchaeota archaeon]